MSLTISAQTFATDILNTVDAVIGNFVQAGYTALIQNNSGVIIALMTLYVMLLGYRALNHTVSMDINTVARHLTVLAVIYSFLIYWKLYWLFFYNIFTNEPLAIAQALTSATGMLPPDQGSAAALDSAFSQGMQAAYQLMHLGTFMSPMPWVYGILIALMTAGFGVAALLLFAYAKLAIAVVLVLGPIFLLFVLWDSTRGFFDKWIQTLVNYALIPIVTSAILMLVLAIDKNVIPGLLNSTGSGTAQFSGIWPYLAFCLLSALLFTQVLSICSALSGGMGLQGISAALPIAGNALKATGMKALGRGMQRFGAKEASRIKSERSSRKAAQIKAGRS